MCSPTLTYSGADVHVRFVDPPEMLTSAGAAAAILAVLEVCLDSQHVQPFTLDFGSDVNIFEISAIKHPTNQLFLAH